MASELEGDCGILGLLPPLNCGCQELISSSIVIHYGWLRKRSLRNKLHLKLFNWPRLYVVLADKNLYSFQNETSRKPTNAVSLHGFNRIMRAGENKQREAIWAFKMEHIQTNIPSLYFSATSEKEMVKWMRLIKREMLKANGKEDRIGDDSEKGDDSQYGGSISDQSCTSSDYNLIEASIYETPMGSNETRPISSADFADEFDEDISYKDFDELPPAKPPKSHSKPLKSPASESDEGSCDNLNEIPAAAQEFPKSSSRPPPQKPESSYCLGKKLKSPQLNGTMPRLSITVKKRPCDGPAGLQWENQDYESVEEEYWASVHFDGNKVQAAELINSLGESGVYLVRKSDDGSNVLVVFTTITKKYKIERKENGSHTLSLISGPYFHNLEELLYHYYTNPLPGCDQKLVTPFKLHSDFKS